MLMGLITSKLGLSAVAVAGAASLLAGVYTAGRIHGWQNHADKVAREDLAALTGQINSFLSDQKVNQAEGDQTRSIITDAARTIEDARHVISEASNAFDCPSDPAVGVSVDTAADAARRAIDRATGRGGDDPPEG
ncbi:hypothetical protein ABWI01_03300 [Oceanicaulis alexandrii]|uniref:hypothetical protein n=1 Tax=Oceanicaulis alexandrii TaxID=153233 RepID=UPI0035D04E41